MEDCLFCKISKGLVPSTKVYEDEYVYAFNDIDPKAPVHVVIVPKKHYDNILEIDDDKIKAALIDSVKKIAKLKSLDENGFRVVINTGSDGGQTVNHLHFHLLGLRQLQWPPG